MMYTFVVGHYVFNLKCQVLKVDLISIFVKCNGSFWKFIYFL